MTVAEFMELSGQGERARRCFWYPLAIATLNEDPALASAALLAEVMKRAFFSRRGDSAFLYSTVGLSDLYCEAARNFIERRDGVVACRAIVERFELDEQGRIARLRLRDGRSLGAANFIAAVPPDRLLKMLPEGASTDPAFAELGEIKSSPIICVHLWLDREVTQAPFVGFIGTTTQWLFNKRRIFAQHGKRHPGYLSFVISGARNLVDHSNDALLDLVVADLHAMIPASRQAKVLKALVLKEKQATIAADPFSDARRPPVITPYRQSFPGRRLDSDRIAGDDRKRRGLRARTAAAAVAARAEAAA